MRTWGFICVALLLVTITSVASSADPAPYLGVYSEVNEDPPGLRIQLSPASPAGDAGLRNGDVILGIDGVMFGDSETPFSEQLTAAISTHKIGDVITIHIYRDAPEMSLLKNGEPVDTPWPRDEFDDAVEQSGFGDTVELKSEKLEQYIDVQATLGPRPDTVGEAFPANNSLSNGLRRMEVAGSNSFPELRKLLEQLIPSSEISGLEIQVLDDEGKRDFISDTLDLRTRLNARATPDDGYRTPDLVYVLRDPLAAAAMPLGIFRSNWQYWSGFSMPGVYDASNYLRDTADSKDWFIDFYEQPKSTEHREFTAEDMEELMNPSKLGLYYHFQPICLAAASFVEFAFSELTEEEIAFMAKQRYELSESFASMHYIDSDDENEQRAALNVELIDLSNKLKFGAIAEAEHWLVRSIDDLYTMDEVRDGHECGRVDFAYMIQKAKEKYADNLTDSILFEEETEYGRIVISGTGESWFTGPQPMLHIDLGGDDFYTYTEGGGSSLDTPVGVIIDLGGNDAYESTTPFSQGSGSMGVSLLVDVEGDDSYIGLQWAQGCGFFGCGRLIDMTGNDTYRGEEFCQAAAIFGSGLLLDYTGDDRYEAQMKSQAFGGTRGVGLLVDVAGDDYRYAKGKYPTGYGDPGIFDAWSQGCAMGFRGLASGGIAGVIDMAGSDYNEAGNFSQGGGYYFGYGFFHDMGWEDDVYIGSRYNQGFSAHQAVGCFLEDGGNDRYITRQAVAQGLAWDECVTMFIDYGGDDYYDGGTGFSQGASAHNSMCIFWDVDGRDTYVYPPGQARAGGNDYHGGTSLSLFLDTGGDTDWYDSDRSGNNLVTGWPEHGFFADLPGTLEDAVADSAWQSLWQVYEPQN